MKFEKKGFKFINWFLTKPTFTSFIIFLLLLSMVLFIVSLRYENIKEKQQIEMRNSLHLVHQNIENSLKNCYTTTLTLALTINDQGKPNNFETIGAQLLASNKIIYTVELVPNGVIKYIYPLEGNEKALNYNILNSPYLQTEARKAIETRQMHFAGPLSLKQGGIGIVGRLPVFINNKFWGFSAVLIKLEALLEKSGIHDIDENKYYFQFSKRNPLTHKEEFFLPIKDDFSKKHYETVSISDTDWKLYLIPKKKYTLLYPILPFIIVSFLFAILLSYLISIFLKKPAELKLLLQNQATKILNSEIKYKTIFDQAAVGIAHVDSYSGNFIEINGQYCKLLGYTAQEMKEKNFQSITHPDDLEEDLLNMEKLKEGKIREYSMEKRFITKSGDNIWVNLTVSPLWKINEIATTHISIIEDISSKKEVEKLIKKSEARFRSLFDESPIPLWEEDYSAVKKYLGELNLMGESEPNVENYFRLHPEVVLKCISLIKIIDVNYECLKLHKTNSKKALLEGLTPLVDDQSIVGLIKQLIAITKGEKQLNLDAKIKNSQGEYRDINIRWNIIRGYEDSLERIIVSTEDITVRKAAEQIILHSQQKIEALVNSIDGIVWECDYKTQELTFISDKSLEMLGFTPEEWKADVHFWEKQIHPDDKENSIESFRKMVSDENYQKDWEYRMINKDGNVIWIRELINVIFENNIPISLRGIMIDITKTKEAEKDLTNTLALVTEQNKRLLNFSYIVSHNLRSHTSNIQSISHLIEASETDEERLELVKMLNVVSDNLDETMHNLNEVVNIQTNISIVIEPLNLLEYVNKSLEVLSDSIKSSEATIINTVSNEIMVKYNTAYLESIILNLVSNAIRYRHPKRKPIIRFSTFTEKNRLVLQISDNGIGIDLKKHGEKIFGMYKTFNNNPEAKGIGLFITKNQVDAMGGNIVVESEPNVGTTFKIYFQ